jgi:hypothetical protein
LLYLPLPLPQLPEVASIQAWGCPLNSCGSRGSKQSTEFYTRREEPTYHLPPLPPAVCLFVSEFSDPIQHLTTLWEGGGWRNRVISGIWAYSSQSHQEVNCMQQPPGSSSWIFGCWAICQLWAQNSLITVILRCWGSSLATETRTTDNCSPHYLSSLLLKFLSKSMSDLTQIHNYLCSHLLFRHGGRVPSGLLSCICLLFSGPQSSSFSDNSPPLKMVPSHNSQRYGKWHNGFPLHCLPAKQEKSPSLQIPTLDLRLARTIGFSCSQDW